MNTPRQILERLFDDAFNVDQALTEIDAYYKSKVPKKKECQCYEGNLWGCYCGAEAYNICIADFHKEE